MLLSASQWHGLLYLQQQPAGLAFTPAEIGRAIERGFYGNDGDLLVRRMLAACHAADRGPRKYAVTPLGSLSRATDDKTSTSLVMVHVPGIRAAASADDEAEAVEIIAEVICADLPEEEHASATSEVFAAIAHVYTSRGRQEPGWLRRARTPSLAPSDTEGGAACACPAGSRRIASPGRRARSPVAAQVVTLSDVADRSFQPAAGQVA